jgi:succinyldiaminopimelate transaminase
MKRYLTDWTVTVRKSEMANAGSLSEVMRVNPALDRVGAHPIAAIQQKVRDLRAAGGRVIDFSIGDPREPTWESVAEAVRDAVPAVSQYPTTTGTPELREAVAGYVERRFGVALDPDTQIMPTSGSKEAIFSSALAFVDRDRGDAVGYPDPGYPVYERGAVMAGARAVAIAADDHFVVTPTQIPDELWPDLAMLWICTPSNPTGSVTSLTDLTALVNRCRARDVLLCSDECYVDLYAPGAEPPPSVLAVTPQDQSGVLSYLSLSKRSGMTGYRSGAVVGDPLAIERLHKLRTSTGTASPEFVQAGAVVAWGDDEHVRSRRQIFEEKRRILRAVFAEAGLSVVASEAGLYLWIEVGDDAVVAEKLAAVGVVVSPGRIFGERGRGYLRLALVPSVEDCHGAGETILEAL